MDPIFWLGFSILLVAVSLTAVLVVAIPAFQELGRAARSAEKMFDTLNRELPPTLEAIRLTGLEISELTDDVTQGVQSAGQVVKQVDQGLGEVKQQAQRVQTTTRSVFAGVKAAWKTLTDAEPPAKGRRSDPDAARKRLPPGSRSPLESPPPRSAAPQRDNRYGPPDLPRAAAYPESPLRVNAADSNGNHPDRLAESTWPSPQTSRNASPGTSETTERHSDSWPRQRSESDFKD
jgi:uncharacterized protein YoxC